jgi:hypothetical protein
MTLDDWLDEPFGIGLRRDYIPHASLIWVKEAWVASRDKPRPAQSGTTIREFMEHLNTRPRKAVIRMVHRINCAGLDDDVAILRSIADYQWMELPNCGEATIAEILSQLSSVPQ